MTEPTSVAADTSPRAGLGRFLRGSLGSGLAVGARTAGALLLNKLLAVYGGPGGLTLLAHFQNLMALFTTLPNDGVNVGVVKYLAPLSPQARRYRGWLGAGVVLTAGAVLAGALALVLVPGPLVGVFRPSESWVALFAFGIALLTAYTFLVSVLLAAGKLRAYIGLTVGLSIIGVAVVGGVLTAGWPVEQALLAYLLAQGTMLLPAWALTSRHGLLPCLPGRISPAALRGLGRYLLMALSLLVFSKGVDFVQRDVLMARFGLAQTDLWQAVAKLSDNYTMVFSAVMGSVYFPRLSALAGQAGPLRAYVRSVLLLLAPTLAVGFGMLFLLRHVLLTVLFDQHFAEAQSLLAPQFIGDWAKFLTWTLLFLLTARAQVGRYVAVQAGSAVLYAGLLIVLLPRLGLIGVPVAHAVRFGLLLLGCGLYFRRYLR
ncbi:hypothetical protein LJY25_01550 [Hymenobacter sp. BT175]|uniref:hypothetical protein n=1 Tax=Hymenobacter translucens TaxID=2886507 RepID=UPI001D0EB889|nr:hypothetical protein [Hymenobacter translucens]MCC2545116.1 hypothetical protein [Hymenobacter translucens]